MNTKSDIQIHIENIQMKYIFENGLQNIMNRFHIDDAVFSLKHGVDELTRGYFVPVGEFTNLNEAVKNMEINQAIRIVDNEQFIIGDYYTKASDCLDRDHVFNVEYLSEL